MVRPQYCNIFLIYFMGVLLYLQKHDLKMAKIQRIALCYLIFSLSGWDVVIGDLLRKKQKPWLCIWKEVQIFWRPSIVV